VRNFNVLNLLKPRFLASLLNDTKRGLVEGSDQRNVLILEKPKAQVYTFDKTFFFREEGYNKAGPYIFMIMLNEARL